MVHDVAIIGGGIIGTSLARELTRYRLKIAIFEKHPDVSMGATKANSAIVHGGYAEGSDTLKGRLCIEGRRRFRELEDELHFGFTETGSLLVSLQDNKEPLERLLRSGIENGLTDLSIIGREEIREMEPNISEEARNALFCKGAGICSPYGMAIAMAENAVENGADLFLSTEVTGIERENGIFNLSTDKGDFQAAFVVNCAGVMSDRVARMAGADGFEILPRSGEYLLFARGTGKLLEHVVFQLPTVMGKGVLVTPTIHGNLLIGPDATDVEDREDTSTHKDRLQNVYNQAKKLYPDIKGESFLRSFTGIRARSSTGDFVIGPSNIKGFINAAGIQSPGLTASPAIAHLLVRILEEEGLRLEPEASFNPFRKPLEASPKDLPYREVDRLSRLPVGKRERIVCRCEQVTEGEIADSMDRGIEVTTVDGIKRRTRAAMGWCQGTFCRQRIAAAMEDLTGKLPDGSYDIERSGVSRIEKNAFLDFLKARKEE